MQFKKRLRTTLAYLTRPKRSRLSIEEIEFSIPILERLGRLEGQAWTPNETEQLRQSLAHFRQFQNIRRWTIFGAKSSFRQSFDELLTNAKLRFSQIGTLPRRNELTSDWAKLKRTDRILFISGHFPSPLHGGGLRVADIIDELAKDFKVDLFTQFNSPEDALSLSSLQSSVQNLHVCASGDSFNPSTLAKWLEKIRLRLADYDVIHLEYPQSVTFADHFSAFNRPLVYTMIENLHRARFLKLRQFLEQGETLFASETWLDLAEVFHVEEKLWKTATARIAVTEDDQKAAEEFFGPSSLVIPTALSSKALIEPLRDKGMLPINSDLFGFLGFFGHQPNLEALDWYCRNVHPIVLKHHPTAIFRIIGQGPLESIQSTFKSLKGLEFVGYVPQIPDALQPLSFCISPLISGSGVRGKLNQYSACRKTTVTTTIGASGLDYLDQDEVFIADSAEDFAMRIVYLLRNPETCVEMGHRAANKAMDRYTWAPQIKKLKSLYERLYSHESLDSRSSPRH